MSESATQDSLAGRVEEALRAGAPGLGVDRVVSVERLTTGLSSKSYRVCAETTRGAATWVMRVEPKHGVIPPYDIPREYHLLAEMGEAGLPVPEVLHLERDAAAVGGRFMLMSFVEGEVYRSSDARLVEDQELRTSMQSQFVETLARIHEAPQTVFPPFHDGPTAARAQVATCRRRLAETELLPNPFVRHILDVLDERAPEAQRLVLLHGDYRLPNLMWRDGKIEGILDWELAAVGDPLCDIAFTQTVGAGPCSIHGDLADQYSQLTGVEMDERRMSYCRLLEMTKSLIIGAASASDLAHGGTDLRLLSVAALSSAGQPMLAALEEQLVEFLEA